MLFLQSKIYMRMNDEEIVLQFRQPDLKEKAFRHLLSNYQERLYYHVRRYVNNHEDANDILQNVCIKVWNAIDSFRGESSLYTWLYRIASNEAITYLNKTNKYAIVDIETTSVKYRGGTDNLDAEALTSKLKQAINTLPDKQKQVFVMRYYDEMTYEQIAEIAETSVGGLKASYHHAVKKIEEYILNH